MPRFATAWLWRGGGFRLDAGLTPLVPRPCARECRFLDMLEQYFEQPDDTKIGDVRKELSYQVRSACGWGRQHCWS
jgi:hypothetical protein